MSTLRPLLAGLLGLAAGLTLAAAIRYSVLPLPGRPPRCPKCGYPTNVHPVTYGRFAPPDQQSEYWHVEATANGRRIVWVQAGTHGPAHYCTTCSREIGRTIAPTPPTAPPAPTNRPADRSDN